MSYRTAVSLPIHYNTDGRVAIVLYFLERTPHLIVRHSHIQVCRIGRIYSVQSAMADVEIERTFEKENMSFSV